MFEGDDKAMDVVAEIRPEGYGPNDDQLIDVVYRKAVYDSGPWLNELFGAIIS